MSNHVKLTKEFEACLNQCQYIEKLKARLKQLEVVIQDETIAYQEALYELACNIRADRSHESDGELPAFVVGDIVYTLTAEEGELAINRCGFIMSDEV